MSEENRQTPNAYFLTLTIDDKSYKQIKQKYNLKDNNDIATKAMKEVGEKLHHQTGGKVTGMTAINSYISPAVSASFFTDLKLRVPAWVPKAGR